MKNKTLETFESYLQGIHCEQNPQLLDDMLPDAFNDWMAEQDPNDLIEWAEKWNKDALSRVREEERERVKKVLVEYFEKGLGFNKGSINDSLFQKLKNDLLQTLNNKE